MAWLTMFLAWIFSRTSCLAFHALPFSLFRHLAFPELRTSFPFSVALYLDSRILRFSTEVKLCNLNFLCQNLAIDWNGGCNVPHPYNKLSSLK